MAAPQVIADRRSKRDLLYDFFRARLHQPVNSFDLHVQFGTAVRARISEINSDPASDIVIRNHTYCCTPNAEVSLYTAYPRYTLFDISPERHRDNG
jgi:hypothetical protein